MRLLGILCCAMLAACVAPYPIPPPAAPLRTASIGAELLAAHNRERALVGNSPLRWDQTLTNAAALYARQLAAHGSLRHSPRQTRPGQGENLWMGTHAAFSVHQMAASWAAERRWFRPGAFPAISSTGNWADVGHYSQMIWPTTMRLGCAVASDGHSDFLVCRYAPAGNIDGRRVP